MAATKPDYEFIPGLPSSQPASLTYQKGPGRCLSVGYTPTTPWAESLKQLASQLWTQKGVKKNGN